MRTILSLVFVVLFISCGSRTENSCCASSAEVAISELLSSPLDYDNNHVTIQGVISHVCRHSGDKMRILQDGSDLSVQVMLGKYTGQFDAGSEGMRIVLSGLVVTEVTNIGELGEEEHECENTLEAVEAMKARGLDASIRTFINLEDYETL